MTHTVDTLMEDVSEIADAVESLRTALESVLNPGYVSTWRHGCAALLQNDIELWVSRCPHCGKPATQKGLFIDLIAQHPGLSEELKAMDDIPITWTPPPRLTEGQVEEVYNTWVMDKRDGYTFTDAIQDAVRRQFGINE
jgi:hypothetical protein